MASVRPEALDPPPSYYGAYSGGGGSSSNDQFTRYNQQQSDLNYPDTNFYNAATNGSANRYVVQAPKTSGNNSGNKKLNCCIPFIDTKLKLVVLIVILIIVTLVIIAGLVIFLLFAISPCTVTKCHSRASTCKNHFLKAQCICDYGYGGDGINYCDECGVVSNQANLRIVGGVSAVAYSWPATALLIFSYKARVFISSTNEYVIISQQSTCGGTLIDRETVLSAAHCIPTELDFKYNNIYYTVEVKPNSYYPTYESMMTVYLGVYDKTQVDVSPAQKFTARKLVRHSSYNANTNLNDIALVLLTSQASLSKYTQIACLPDYKLSGSGNYPTQVNIPGYIVGWGDLYGNRTYSNVLQNAQINVYNSTACSAVFPSVAKNWNSQICAGNLTGGVDSCQGDSGGSLYVKGAVNDQSKYITSGVVSYGNGCALAGYPGIYTRVSYYIDWILYEKWA